MATLISRQTALRYKTRQIMAAKAKAGDLSGCAPLGYQNMRQGNTTWIAVDPAKAAMVVRAFALAAEGTLSLRQIVKILYGEGLTSRNGKPLGVSALWSILTNPFYYGNLYYRGEFLSGNHEPLVSREIWKKVQEVLMQRRRNTLQ